MHVVEPGTGALASRGEWGVGRLAEPPDLLAALELAAGTGAPRPLDGLRVLVTAGGTREPIDSVRYIGNRSSGRMGFALAAEAARRGAEVTIVAANAGPRASPGVAVIGVETAEELERETLERFSSCDVLLMAAAVADYRPAHAEDGKISKDRARRARASSSCATTDILAEAASRAPSGPDSPRLRRRARPRGHRREPGTKLERKGLDAIVVNDISREDIGFDSDENEVTIVAARRRASGSHASKHEIAAAVLDA